MEGCAFAPGGISLVNAIVTGRGATAAIDLGVRATVELDPGVDPVEGTAIDHPELDTTLIETCVNRVIERYGAGEGGRVRTSTTLPPSVGLKTSSASASAVALATLAALGLDETVDRIELAHLVVEVTRATGVTVTGALDDTAASLLGGLVVTDNDADAILTRTTLERDVTILIPGTGAPSTAVDVDGLRSFASIGELAMELLDRERFALAMTVNGLAISTALGHDPDPIAAGLDQAEGVSVSGTGPAVAAIGPADAMNLLSSTWASYGTVLRTELRASGAMVR